MKVRNALIVAVVALLPMSVMGAGAKSAQAMFNKLDTNQDGYISQDEAKADTQLSKNWSDADLNKDGKVEESEFSAFEISMEPASGTMD